jgi:hypothetical protein
MESIRSSARIDSLDTTTQRIISSIYLSERNTSQFIVGAIKSEIKYILPAIAQLLVAMNQQKSQSRFLRAFLFQILANYPELVPICFPEAWAALYSENIRHRLQTGRIS